MHVITCVSNVNQYDGGPMHWWPIWQPSRAVVNNCIGPEGANRKNFPRPPALEKRKKSPLAAAPVSGKKGGGVFRAPGAKFARFPSPFCLYRRPKSARKSGTLHTGVRDLQLWSGIPRVTANISEKYKA